ncbi:protein PLANT CADMIUM RESISTANCE 2-like [Heracleum sosnowskyi]|uniref:Protein PLANT CADMIUM RESISTANCE 2-like n=1 Tax=Heracleum sosnowskyi TaxID=360622 RepID=A0AAD8N070_9APIA|nr:protein PLANT CADMIUM RESISTANCE 2-like [Heracleum sosnowskyi]
MYSTNANNYDKSPRPSAPPAYQYGQPPPITGVPLQYSSEPAMWSTGLFDCLSDFPQCVVTCCCPCISFGQIAEILDKGSTSCVTSGALYALITLVSGCGCMYSCFYRTKIRKQYMLEERPCGDCLVHLCCELCALCQEHRELRIRGFDMSLGWQGNLERQNGGMAMAPIVPQSGMSR